MLRRTLITVLLFAGCTQPASQQQFVDDLTPVAKPPESVELRDPASFVVGGVETPAPALSVRTSVKPREFDAEQPDEVRDVTIAVDVEGARPGELALEFVAPDGAIYERRVRELAGSPYDRHHFEFTLPIAGTWIESQQMGGAWQARVSLHDVERLQAFEVPR